MTTILLVEDEHLERLAIRRLLEINRPEYKIVAEAGNGQEALTLAQKWNPSIILMDIQMPILSGIDVAKKLQGTVDSKIIFLTAHNEFEYAREGIRLQVSDYLLKPIRQKKLLQVLDKLAKEEEKVDPKPQKSPLADLIKKANIVDIHNLLSAHLDELGPEDYGQFRYEIEEAILELSGDLPKKIGDLWQKSVGEMRKITCMGIWVYSLLWLLDQMGAYFYQQSKKMEGGSMYLSLQYIELHLRDKLNLGILSKEVGFSTSYYSRIFKEDQNRTLTDYIQMRRVFYGEMLLKHTNLTINEIAEDCGFNEANYFSRVFKERRGISPTDFRGEKI